MKKTQTKSLLALLTMLLAGTLGAWADIDVQGLVTDSSGEPLIGVTVVEKGTTPWCIYRHRR